MIENLIDKRMVKSFSRLRNTVDNMWCYPFYLQGYRILCAVVLCLLSGIGDIEEN